MTASGTDPGLLLRRLDELATRVGTARSLLDVNRALLAFLEATVPFSGMFVALYDADRGLRIPLYAAGEGVEDDVSELPPLPLTGTPMSRAIETGEVVITQDWEAAVRGKPHVNLDPEGVGPGSSVAVPLKVLGRVIGAFEIQADDPGAFRQEHVPAITMAADLAAMAMENVRLLERERELRREAEASERYYRSLVENTADVILVLDLDRRITFASPALTRVLGHRTDQVTGVDLATLAHPDDRSSLKQAVQASVEQPAGTASFEVRLLDVDDSWRTVEGSCQAFDEGDRQGIVVTARDVTERRWIEEERRQLMARLVSVQEDERARIAEDIHDDSVQVMTAVSMRLGMIRAQLPEEERKALQRVEENVRRTIARLRHLMFELKPPALEQHGLAAAVRMALERLEDEYGIRTRLEDRLLQEPDEESRTVLFRIAQEALANVRKHSGAREVRVELESRDGGTLVRVADDGQGFVVSDVLGPRPGHLGLVAMRERAELAGGWTAIDSAPGHGTVVEFWAPIAGGADAGDPSAS